MRFADKLCAALEYAGYVGPGFEQAAADAGLSIEQMDALLNDQPFDEVLVQEQQVGFFVWLSRIWPVPATPEGIMQEARRDIMQARKGKPATS